MHQKLEQFTNMVVVEIVVVVDAVIIVASAAVVDGVASLHVVVAGALPGFVAPAPTAPTCPARWDSSDS